MSRPFGSKNKTHVSYDHKRELKREAEQRYRDKHRENINAYQREWQKNYRRRMKLNPNNYFTGQRQPFIFD
jgi:hypothetical protein